MITAPEGFPVPGPGAQDLGMRIAILAVQNSGNVSSTELAEGTVHAATLLLLACSRTGKTQEMLSKVAEMMRQMSLHPEYLEQLKIMISPAAGGRVN